MATEPKPPPAWVGYVLGGVAPAPADEAIAKIVHAMPLPKDDDPGVFIGVWLAEKTASLPVPKWLEKELGVGRTMHEFKRGFVAGSRVESALWLEALWPMLDELRRATDRPFWVSAWVIGAFLRANDPVVKYWSASWRLCPPGCCNW